jgi:hypothetical protein
MVEQDCKIYKSINEYWGMNLFFYQDIFLNESSNLDKKINSKYIIDKFGFTAQYRYDMKKWSIFPTRLGTLSILRSMSLGGNYFIRDWDYFHEQVGQIVLITFKVKEI